MLTTLTSILAPVMNFQSLMHELMCQCLLSCDCKRAGGGREVSGRARRPREPGFMVRRSPQADNFQSSLSGLRRPTCPREDHLLTRTTDSPLKGTANELQETTGAKQDGARINTCLNHNGQVRPKRSISKVYERHRRKLKKCYPLIALLTRTVFSNISGLTRPHLIRLSNK